MLEKIRSKNILKKVIPFLDTGRKLRLFIYNKKWQNIFGINIIDYIRYGGKYFKGEINGKGKEYNYQNNSLIFEGNYLNGKRNGKGIEYDSKIRIIYEGEYFDGKKNGFGREYRWIETNQRNRSIKELVFEGTYVNGLKNGVGKEYKRWYNGQSLLIFEGEWIRIWI